MGSAKCQKRPRDVGSGGLEDPWGEGKPEAAGCGGWPGGCRGGGPRKDSESPWREVDLGAGPRAYLNRRRDDFDFTY